MESSTVTVTKISETGQDIPEKAFGAHDYQQLGDPSWEAFDGDTGPTEVRYPAGNYAETVFDIENPNAGSYVDEKGLTHSLTPMSDMLAFAREHEMDPVVVIPTAFALGDKDKDGQRVFDTGATEKIEAYVRFLLDEMAEGHIARIEIGSEYASYMTPTEYERVASSMSDIVQDTIDAYVAEKALEDWEEPEIALQTPDHSLNGDQDIPEMAARFKKGPGQSEEEERRAADAMGDGFALGTLRSVGEINAHDIQNLDLVASMDRIKLSGDAQGGDLFHMASVWNVQHQLDDAGAAQDIAYIMKLMAALTAEGLEELAELGGDLDGLSIAAFQGEAGMELFAALLRDAPMTFHFNVNVSGYDFDIGEALISVGVGAPDGGGQTVTGLPSLPDVGLPNGLDPFDVPLPFGGAETLEVAPVDPGAAAGDFAESSFGSQWRAVIEAVQNDVVTRLLHGDEDDALWELGADDRLADGDLSAFGWAVSVTMTDALTDVLSRGSISYAFGGPLKVVGTLTNTEALTGSEFHDWLAGQDGANLLRGQGGNDRIYGFGGNDVIAGGDGNDVIRAGEGDDYIIFEGGSRFDWMHGDGGTDVVDFSLHHAGISVSLALKWQPVFSNGDLIARMTNVESLIGTRFDDRLIGNDEDNELAGGAGNDALTGGAGRDLFVFFGAGQGDDAITDFQDGIDLIALQGAQWGDLQISQQGNDTLITYDAGSVTLNGIDAGLITAEDFLLG